MKKVYCDRCGKEMEQNGNILLRKTDAYGNPSEEYFDICDKCRVVFYSSKHYNYLIIILYYNIIL